MKLFITGFCLMVVSLIAGAITLNNWFTIPMWIGLIYAISEPFISKPNKSLGGEKDEKDIINMYDS